MATTLDQVIANLGALGYWDISTGAAISGTYGAIATLSNVTVPGTEIFDKTGGGSPADFNGTNAIAYSDKTIGAAVAALANGDGCLVYIPYRMALAQPNGRCVCSCMDDAGANGFEIGFGLDHNFAADGGLNSLTVAVYGASGNQYTIFTHKADQSTFSRFADGKTHHLFVFLRTDVDRTGILQHRAWFDGTELVGASGWGNPTSAAGTITTTNCKLAFGARRQTTNDLYWAGTLKAPAIFKGLIDQADMVDIMKAAQQCAGEIPGSYRLDVDAAVLAGTIYNDAGATVAAAVGDQVIVAKSADALITYTAPVATGSITAATTASPTVFTTSAPHGLIVGQVVKITGATNTALNGYHQVSAVADTTHFSIAVSNVGGSNSTATWTVNHGPYLGRDEAGHYYLDFVNRFQRRGWTEPMGNLQHWLEATLDSYPFYSGVYVVGSPNVARLHTQSQQILGFISKPSGSITGITTSATAPEFTTSAAHGLTNGQTVTVAGTTATATSTPFGNTGLNHPWVITVTATNKFTVSANCSAVSVGTGTFTSERPHYALDLDGQTPDMRPCVDVGASVVRTPSSTSMTIPSSSPGISCMGMSLGFYGLSAESGTGATYCDGQISALSGALNLGATSGNPEKDKATYIRVGPLNTAILGDDGANVHPTCNGIDGRLYVIEIHPTRTITEVELRRSEAADRARLGLPKTFLGAATFVGDSTWSGEQDNTGGGVIARTTGLRKLKVQNLSYPGVTSVTWSTYYDLTSAKLKHNLPSVGVYALGINASAGSKVDINNCQNTMNGVRSLGGGSFYAIAGLLPASPGVSANVAFDAWSASGRSPFDASYRRTPSDNTATPATSYDNPGKHPNPQGCIDEAAALSAPMAVAVASVGAVASNVRTMPSGRSRSR